MKNFKKRFLSLLAAIAVATTAVAGVGVSTLVSAAETATAEQTVIDGINKDEENLLLHLGILRAAGPNQAATLTRGAMAQQASRLAQLPEYKGGEKYFHDVPETHLNYKEIYAMAEAGILCGDGTGFYRPDDPVSPAEICKVYAAILGYKEILPYEDYLRMANRLGITEGVNFKGDVTIGQMLRILCNTLDLEMMEPVSYGTDKVEYKAQQGYRAIERYYGLVKQEGIVEGVRGTTLTDIDASLGKGDILINDFIYHYDDESLLGKRVVFYTKRDGMKGGFLQEIEFLYVPADRNKVITISAEDIEGKYDQEFRYYIGDREVSLRVEKAADLIYNGVAFPSYKPEDLKPADGDVTLIDNNGDGRYDVFLVNSYSYMMVENVDVANQVIYGKYSNVKKVGSKEQDANISVMMEAGTIGELSWLRGGDVITIRESKNTTGTKVIDINLLSDGIVGIVEGIKGNVYTIGGVPYKITDATAIDEELRIGETVTVYTFNGRCAAIIHASNDDYKFAYLIDYANVGTIFTGRLAIKVVDTYQQKHEFKAADKLFIDEMKFTDYEAIKTRLKTAAGMRKVGATVTDEARLAALADGEKAFPLSQPIRYRLDNEGKLTHIDTIIFNDATEDSNSLQVYDGVQEEGPSSQAVSHLTYYDPYSRNLFVPDGSLFVTWKNTSNLLAPPEFERDKTEDYATALVNHACTNIVEAYTVDPVTKLAEYIVAYSQVEEVVNTNSTPYIVKGTEKALDEEGNMVTRVVVYGGGGAVSYPLAKDVIVDDGSDINSILTPGDIVSFNLDRTNTIRRIAPWIDISEADKRPLSNRYDYRGSTSYGNFTYMKKTAWTYGTVLSYSDGFLRHTNGIYTDPKGGVFCEGTVKNNYLVSGSTAFYRYTEENGVPKVEEASVSDMIPYMSDRGSTQRALVNTSIGSLKFVYLIDTEAE